MDLASSLNTLHGFGFFELGRGYRKTTDPRSPLYDMNMVTTLYAAQMRHIYGGGPEGLAYNYRYRSLGCCLVTNLMVRPGRSMARDILDGG